MISGSSYDEQIDRSQSPFLCAPQKKESPRQAGLDNKQTEIVGILVISRKPEFPVWFVFCYRVLAELRSEHFVWCFGKHSARVPLQEKQIQFLQIQSHLGLQAQARPINLSRIHYLVESWIKSFDEENYIAMLAVDGQCLTVPA